MPKLMLFLFFAIAAQSVLADDEKEAKEFEFALIGDVPYATGDRHKMINLIDDINDNDDLQWVVHVGDIKTGGSPCSDAVLLDRLQLFQQFKAPVIYTPGDNEWTDCHRVGAGEYAPLERLQQLRRLFFPRPGQVIGGGMKVTSQADDAAHAEFVENVRWQRGGVLFVTLHVVGSLNGLADFDNASRVQRSGDDDAEVSRRIDAAIAWLEESFALARQRDLAGVMLIFHADPNFEDAIHSDNRRGFNAVLAAMEKHTLAFGKPVLAAHGDSHYFRYDKPLHHHASGKRIENFSRVETFGGSDVHWLRIKVDSDDPQVFSVNEEIIEANRFIHLLP